MGMISRFWCAMGVTPFNQYLARTPFSGLEEFGIPVVGDSR